MMRISKLAILSGLWLIGAIAWSAGGQQATGQVSAPATRKAAASSPADFQVTQDDINLARDVGRALVAGNHDQVQKMLTASRLSIPQFERVVAAICDLSAERRLASTAGLPGAPPGSLTPATISNRQALQEELAARINAEFGGRGQNYKNASALVKRQPSAADEVCSSSALHAQGAR